MKKRIFSILTALCLCLTLLPTMAAAEKTAGTATEVKTSDELVGALANPTITTIKLKKDITVNATEKVKELTIDRPITLEKGGEDNSRVLYLYRLLTIAESGALTLENGAYFYPLSSVEVYGKFTVGAGCGVLFEGENASLVINEGGIVTTQPAGENTISGLLSLGKNAALTVDGALVNNGRLSVSDMENLKKAASIGGDLILDDITITEDYTLDMKGCTLTIGHITFLDANLTVKNASRVDATGVTISGGSYYCPVTVGNAEGVITGGSFYGPVTVKKISDATPAYISGGTFYNELKGSYITKGCIVTFMNGSSQYAMQVVKDKASAPDTPVKSGYRFVGWYSGDAKWDFDTLVTENLTLTAKWEKIHTSAPSAPRYDVAVSDGAHGSVTVSPKSASKGSAVTVTVTPDKGYALETLAVTDKNGSALDLTDKGGGQYTFTMPSSPVTVAATFMDDNTMLYRFAKAQGMDTTQGGMAIREFDDFDAVPAYALEAMDWAVNAGVLKGDNNRLLPQDNCTRAQIVTMLYRALGEK